MNARARILNAGVQVECLKEVRVKWFIVSQEWNLMALLLCLVLSFALELAARIKCWPGRPTGQQLMIMVMHASNASPLLYCISFFSRAEINIWSNREPREPSQQPSEVDR